MPDEMTAESMIRREIERRKDAFTFLAIGICIMLVGLGFLAVFAYSGDIPPMAGSFAVILVGLYLYYKGHQGRVQVRALEYQLSAMPRSSNRMPTPGPPSTKFCKHCGKVITNDSAFCEHCGRSL